MNSVVTRNEERISFRTNAIPLRSANFPHTVVLGGGRFLLCALQFQTVCYLDEKRCFVLEGEQECSWRGEANGYTFTIVRKSKSLFLSLHDPDGTHWRATLTKE